MLIPLGHNDHLLRLSKLTPLSSGPNRGKSRPEREVIAQFLEMV